MTIKKSYCSHSACLPRHSETKAAILDCGGYDDAFSVRWRGHNIHGPALKTINRFMVGFKLQEWKRTRAMNLKDCISLGGHSEPNRSPVRGDIFVAQGKRVRERSPGLSCAKIQPPFSRECGTRDSASPICGISFAIPGPTRGLTEVENRSSGNSSSPPPKSTPPNPKSTVDLGLEPLIWVENTLLTPDSSGQKHSICPITTRQSNS